MTSARIAKVFYTTDAGFAVPTLASIESLRRWPSGRAAAVSVVLLGMSEAQIDAFERRSADLNVELHCISAEALAEFDNENFHQTHVPYSTLARFLTPQFISKAELCDILYIDGDTWFVQDPQELLEIHAPEAGLLACEDQSDFYWNDIGSTGRTVRAYFNDISVRSSNGYFNAGVIKCRSNEWHRISSECLSYLKQNMRLCRYHDQSALNAVAGPSRVRLSPVWNFQTPYWRWGLDGIAQPKLLHFVGGYKPWMGFMTAWSSIHSDYNRTILKRSDATLPLRTWTSSEQEQVLAQERITNLKLNTIFHHRVLFRRHRYKKLLKTSAA